MASPTVDLASLLDAAISLLDVLTNAGENSEEATAGGAKVGRGGGGAEGGDE